MRRPDPNRERDYRIWLAIGAGIVVLILGTTFIRAFLGL